MSTFFISTAIPYVNAAPHIGHALEFVQADIIARYQQMMRGAEEVYSLSGSDDNAMKNVQAAEAAGVPVAEYVQKNVQVFKDLHTALGNNVTYFISTSADSQHAKGAQKLWSACKKEDIYTKKYSGHYCIGCEEFKTEKELENGMCPEHPGKKLEVIEEENYFFRLSNYAARLEELIVSGKLKIVPEGRKKETLAFIRSGLEDFSISRSQLRAKGWGVPVPGDANQVMYVWYDALANYITALGYADEGETYKKFWCGEGDKVHLIGKGINRFHCIYWPAMLMSAGVPLPSHVVLHGYITVNGQKMSKTLGNVVDPMELIKTYGGETVRYYFARHISMFEDGDYRDDAIKDAYNTFLANGLGNLTSRVMKMATTHIPSSVLPLEVKIPANYHKAFSEFNITEAANCVWSEIVQADGYINQTVPFKTVKIDKEKAVADIKELVKRLYLITKMLLPFMPETAAKIQAHIKEHTMPSPMFARIG